MFGYSVNTVFLLALSRCDPVLTGLPKHCKWHVAFVLFRMLCHPVSPARRHMTWYDYEEDSNSFLKKHVRKTSSKSLIVTTRHADFFHITF